MRLFPLRVRLAALVRPDDGRCCDCGEQRGTTWVRTWHMTAARPWTYLVPDLERRCYDCWIAADLGRGEA